MIIKNTKGYLRDKYIRNSQRYWNIERLKHEFTPKYNYLFKDNTFFYIEKSYTAELTKSEIINQYGLWFFIENIRKKYLAISKKWYGSHTNADSYFYQLSKKTELLKKSQVDKYLFSRAKVNLLCSEDFYPKKYDILRTVSVFDFMTKYNITKEDVIKILLFRSWTFRKYHILGDLANSVELTDQSKLDIMTIIEDYITFPIERHHEKLIPLFSKEDNLLALHYFSLPSNVILTNSDVLKNFNETKSYIAIKRKAENGTQTAPRWYRKMEDKKIENKFNRENKRALENKEYDIVNAKWLRYVKNGSWYF